MLGITRLLQADTLAFASSGLDKFGIVALQRTEIMSCVKVSLCNQILEFSVPAASRYLCPVLILR